MINRITTAVAVFLLLSLAGRSQVSVTAQAYAEVMEALSAAETSQMNFGRFSTLMNGGQVVLSPSGERISQGSVMLNGGFAQPGIFTVTGAPDASFTIQLPQGPALLIHQGSNKTMTVDGWASDPPAGNGNIILQQGQETVSIGATLQVGPIEDNPVGMYTGSFSLTFAYN